MQSGVVEPTGRRPWGVECVAHQPPRRAFSSTERSRRQLDSAARHRRARRGAADVRTAAAAWQPTNAGFRESRRPIPGREPESANCSALVRPEPDHGQALVRYSVRPGRRPVDRGAEVRAYRDTDGRVEVFVTTITRRGLEQEHLDVGTVAVSWHGSGDEPSRRVTWPASRSVDERRLDLTCAGSVDGKPRAATMALEHLACENRSGVVGGGRDVWGASHPVARRQARPAGRSGNARPEAVDDRFEPTARRGDDSSTTGGMSACVCSAGHCSNCMGGQSAPVSPRAVVRTDSMEAAARRGRRREPLRARRSALR